MNNLEQGLKDLFEDGVDKVHVLADFDGTLSKEYLEGKKTASIISILRNTPGYLSPEYQAAAHQLHDEYFKYERNLELSLQERKAKMTEWWNRHADLLIKSGLRKEHIEKLAKSGLIEWRPGAKNFLKLMEKLKIPVVIISASGVGQAIEYYCQGQNVDEGIHYLVNQFIWDENGLAVGHKQPVIHSLNKDETVVHEHQEIWNEVQDRVNVLLLGNNNGDAEMVKGFKYKKLFSIGFLDDEEKDRQGDLEKSFDQVIVEEGYMQINKIIEEINN
jgi:HAD superfamily hydrolase (TIGR01544 family)